MPHSHISTTDVSLGGVTRSGSSLLIVEHKVTDADSTLRSDEGGLCSSQIRFFGGGNHLNVSLETVEVWDQDFLGSFKTVSSGH